MADAPKIQRTEIFAKVNQQVTAKVSNRLQQKAKRILEIAIGNIGKTYSGHHPENGKLLKDSGKVEQLGNGWAVTFKHPIAQLHHNGAPAHVIPFDRTLRDDGSFVGTTHGKPALFRNKPGGYRFFAVHPVHHPGFTGNPYLDNAVKSQGLRASGALKRGTAGPFPVFRSKDSFA